MVTGTMGINRDPSCDRYMDPDMAPGFSSNPDYFIVWLTAQAIQIRTAPAGLWPVGTYVATCGSPDDRHPYKPWTSTNSETAVGPWTQTQPLACSKIHRVAVKHIQKNSKNMAITCFVYIKHMSLKILSIPSFSSLLISVLKHTFII